MLNTPRRTQSGCRAVTGALDLRVTVTGMADGAEFCWISREGHLQSGDRERMLACLKDGSLPTDNPVTRAGWAGWFAAREVIANDGAPTTREPTFDLVRVSRRFDLDADSTIQRLKKLPSFEDAPDTVRESKPPILPEPSNPTQELPTVPTGMPAFCLEDEADSKSPAPSASRVTLQSPQFPPKLAELLSAPKPLLKPPPLPATAVAPAPDGPQVVTPTQVPSVFPTAIDVSPSARSASPWPAVVGVGLALAGAATAAMIVAHAASQLEAPTLRSAARVTIPKVTPKAVLQSQCRAVGDPRLLTKIVPPGSTVHVGGERRLQVGVPNSLKSGLGLTLEPADLSEHSREVFEDTVRVSGIVPRGDGGFAVDRYTVSVAGRFSLGMTPEGFARIDSDGTRRGIWPGEASSVITRPIVAPALGGDFVVAFRRGDGGGSVRVGIVDSDGNKRTELARLGTDLIGAGSPSVAVGADSTAVLFSGMDRDGVRRLYMGVAPSGAVPNAVQALELSPQTPSSPSIAALEGGRFLVAWVERRGGGRRVMGRVVDAKLRPVAPTTTWADVDVPVASTELWVRPKGAAVLITKVAASSRHELSAVRLECLPQSPSLASP